MPLPDESSFAKPSELRRKYQEMIDAQKGTAQQPPEPPKPRLSIFDMGKRRGSASSATADGSEKDKGEKPLPAPPSEEEQAKAETVAFRSAGLPEKPKEGEQHGRKNAKEAFPDMQEAPAVVTDPLPASYEEKEEGVATQKGSAVEKSAKVDEGEKEDAAPANLSQPFTSDSAPVRRSPVPFPIVTKPSLDIPPPVPVPGSTDEISPSLSPVAEPLSPSSPGPLSPSTVGPTSPPRTPRLGGAKEGLSRPTSPAAEEHALRVPPTRDADSPPPPTDDDGENKGIVDSPSAASLHLSPPDSPTDSRSSSPRLARAPLIHGVTTPTASSLAKTRQRVSSTATSPTRSRTPSLASTPTDSLSGRRLSTTSLSSSTRTSLHAASPPLPQAAFMSPSHSRDSIASSSSTSALAPAASAPSSTRRSPLPGTSSIINPSDARRRSPSVVSTASTTSRTRAPPVPTTSSSLPSTPAAKRSSLIPSATSPANTRRGSLTPSTDRAKTPSAGTTDRTPVKRAWGAPSSSVAASGAAKPSSATKSSPAATKPSPAPRRTSTSTSASTSASVETAPSASATASPPLRGRGAPTMRRPAGRGRIGLAGAGAVRGGRGGGAVATAGGAGRQVKVGENGGEVENGGHAKNSEAEKGEKAENGHPAAPASTSSTAESTTSTNASTSDDAAPAPSSVSAPPSSNAGEVDVDSMPVFAGFGAHRPVGKIGIPVEVVNEETGKVRAKGADELEEVAKKREEAEGENGKDGE